MTFTSPKFIAPCIVLALAALTFASCGQQTPTAPSSVVASGALQTMVTEHFVTLADEEPAPAPAPAPPPPSGSAPSPWPPGPPPTAAPGVPVPTAPSTHFRVAMKVDPEPVAHSGIPVGTLGCRDHKYTWYYDQILHAETGVRVTFTERENFFDGRFVSKNGETIELGGNATVILHTRWCSSYATPHYAQTRFNGRDEYNEPITISGPWVRLLTP